MKRKLLSLYLYNFRNLVEQTVQIDGDSILIYGNNGQGKSSLLEAIYLLSTLRSFKTPKIKEVIRYGEKDSSVIGEFYPNYEKVKVIVGDVKSVYVNERLVNAPQDHFVNFPIVLFTTNTKLIVTGEPTFRRRFLDRTLVQIDKEYTKNILEYNSILNSMKLILKEIKEIENIKLTFLCYGELLFKRGYYITQKREELVERLEHGANKIKESFNINFDIKIDYISDMVFEREKFNERVLLSLEKKKIKLLPGPHHDELYIRFNGKEAKRFASMGECKLISLVMVLAQYEIIKEKNGIIPILLFDDLQSELDSVHFLNIIKKLRSQNEGQLFLTALNDDFKHLFDSLYYIKEGKLNQL